MSGGQPASAVTVEAATRSTPDPPAGVGRATRPTSARAAERDARGRYSDAVARAVTQLRLAEEGFDRSAIEIDKHRQQALAAEARRGISCPLSVRASPDIAATSGLGTSELVQPLGRSLVALKRHGRRTSRRALHGFHRVTTHGNA